MLKKFWFLIILPVIIGLLINWLTPIDIPGTIWKVFFWFIHLFLIKIYLPVWGIILLILTVPFLIILFVLLFDNDKSVENYRSDTFFEVLWEWDYDFEGKIWDERIKARCPRCKTILKIVEDSEPPYGYFTNLTCTHCGLLKKINFNSDELRNRIKKEIERKIHTGEYKKNT